MGAFKVEKVEMWCNIHKKYSDIVQIKGTNHCKDCIEKKKKED